MMFVKPKTSKMSYFKSEIPNTVGIKSERSKIYEWKKPNLGKSVRSVSVEIAELQRVT